MNASSIFLETFQTVFENLHQRNVAENWIWTLQQSLPHKNSKEKFWSHLNSEFLSGVGESELQRCK